MKYVFLILICCITMLRADITWVGAPIVTANSSGNSFEAGVSATTSGNTLDVSANCEIPAASCSIYFDVQQQFNVPTAATYTVATEISGSIQASDCSPFTCTPYYASINSTLAGATDLGDVFPFPNTNITLSGTPVSITGSSYYACPDPSYCDTFLNVSGSNIDTVFLPAGTEYLDISYLWSVESTGDPQFGAQFTVAVTETTPEPAMPVLIVLLVGVATLKRYLSAQPIHTFRWKRTNP